MLKFLGGSKKKKSKSHLKDDDEVSVSGLSVDSYSPADATDRQSPTTPASVVQSPSSLIKSDASSPRPADELPSRQPSAVNLLTSTETRKGAGLSSGSKTPTGLGVADGSKLSASTSSKSVPSSLKTPDHMTVSLIVGIMKSNICG